MISNNFGGIDVYTKLPSSTCKILTHVGHNLRSVHISTRCPSGKITIHVTQTQITNHKIVSNRK